MLHAAAAQHRHSEKEAEHQAIQGDHYVSLGKRSLLEVHECVITVFNSNRVAWASGGAVFSAQRRVGVVLGHGAHRGVPGGSQ